MSGAKKYDFSSFDDAASKKQESQKKYDFSDFDVSVKKKEITTKPSGNGSEIDQSGIPTVSLSPSPSQKTSQPSEEPSQPSYDEKSWTANPLNPMSAVKPTAQQPQQPKPKKDWKDVIFDKSSFHTPNQADATYVAKPITGEKIEQVEKGRANMQSAIDNTTERALKSKGLLVTKNSPTYIKQRKKVEDAIKNGDASYTLDPITKQPALSQNTNFADAAFKSLKAAINDEDEADEFVNNMTTKQRTDYANGKIQQGYTEEGYAVTSNPRVGSILGIPVSGAISDILTKTAETGGGAIPFVTKMTAGTMAGAGLAALAPETGGASLAGIPAVMGFAFTTPSAVTQGGKNEVMRRYNELKKQYQGQDVPDEELMKQAESGLYSGEITGGLTNLAFSAIGAKPISAEVAPVIEKTLSNVLKSTAKGTAKSGLELGGISAAGTAAQEAEAGIEDKRYRKNAGELIGDVSNSFVGGLTTGALLHLTTQSVLGTVSLPGQLKSVVKYGLSKENPVELQTILSNNEAIGNVPSGTTDVVMKDINSYNQALNKTSQDLTPETQASVAGLIQKRDNLMQEMANKDQTQVDSYLQQVDALNRQIKNITETNDPSAHEVNDITGQKLDGSIAELPEQKKEGEQAYRVDYRDEQGNPAHKYFNNEEESKVFFQEQPTPPTGIEGYYEKLPKGEEVEIIKTKEYDKENKPGVPSEVGVGEVAEAPTQENVTERLNINNPFYIKVSKALSDLGLIKEYNPETGEGDVVGGYVQPDSRGGFAAGDVYFNKDGSISYIKGDVVVKFDKNGDVISENTKEAAKNKRKIEIEGKKESISSLKNIRDSEDFKYKTVTETDAIGNKKKVRRLKTEQELKESTDKINDAISKAESELKDLEAELPKQENVGEKVTAKDVYEYNGKKYEVTETNITDLETGDLKPIEFKDEVVNNGKLIEEVQAELPEQKTVEQLRADEQAELDTKIPNAEQYRVDGKVDRSKLTNEADKKAFDEVYDKYDKLITPLLKEEKVGEEEVAPIKAEAEVPKHNKDNQPEFTTSTGRQKVNRVGDELIVTDTKTGEPVSRKTHNKAVDEYVNNFDFTHGEEGESQSMEPKKAVEEIVESSNNPSQLATLYAEQDVPFEIKDMTKDDMIADYGLGGISKDSYRRFGDINKLSRKMLSNYIAKKGEASTTIDSMAKSISDHYFPDGDGTEITPNDLVEFMEKYESKKELMDKKNPLLSSIADKFQKLTGIKLTREVARKAINQQVEKISQEEQNLLKQDYESAKQLEDNYWRDYKATDGFAKEAPITEAPQAGEEVKGTEKPTGAEPGAAEGGKPPVPPTTEPTGEPAKPSEPTKGISKEALKTDYNFVKEFESKTVQQIADNAMSNLESDAKENGISVSEQAEHEVSKMMDKKGQSSEQDIMTAAYHLRDLDDQIAAANEKGKDASILLAKRERALEALRALGNRAGTNLRLFASAYSKVEGNRLEVMRASIKKDLGVSDLPKTITELKISKMSDADKAKVKPYVEAIEELNKNLKEINDKANKEIKEADKKEIEDYIKKEIERRLKEEKTPGKNKKSSDKLRKLAQKVRDSKTLHSLGLGTPIEASTKGISFNVKEALAKVLESMADGVDKVEAISKILKEYGLDKSKDFSDLVDKAIKKTSKPDLDETVDSIKNIAENKNATSITKDMVYNNHINDFVNNFIDSDIPYDKVIPEATAELKNYLPDVTEQQVSDAILKRGEFKQDTKKRLETELDKKKKDVIRLEKTKNKLSALEAGVDAEAINADGSLSAKEKKEAIEKRKSDYEKNIDAEIKKLEEEKKKLSKSSKSQKDLKEKIDAINREIDHVKENKSAFNSALKDPKKANQEIEQAKQELKDEYGKAGIRIESGSKTEIKIAQDAEKAIKEIKESDLPEDVKDEHIKEVEKSRDEQLKNTKQGVLISLKDGIDSKIDELNDILNDKKTDKKTADSVREVKKDLEGLSGRLSPTKENLKDQIDKADQDLTALIETHKGTEYENYLIDIQDKFRDSWQQTADNIQRQLLIDKAERNIKNIERQINAGQYTSIPTTEFDAQRDAVVARKQAETQNAYKKLTSLAAKAKEEQQKKNIVDKYNELRRELMVMSFGAIEKVGLSGITKPIFDPLIKQTFGRISGLITGVKPAELENISKTYKQFKTQENADKHIAKTNDEYISAIINHEKAVKDFGKDSKEAEAAKKKLDSAEIKKDAALAFLYLNAGSHIDIAQVMMNGATDFDAKIGKYKQSFANERTRLQNMWYLIQSMNRSHGAIKSISHRQALMDEYIENLQHFQEKDGKITNENRQEAWDLAVLISEAGRFGEETKLSRVTGALKGSKNPFVRGAANFTLAVAKIGINITKQGIDMALPGVELAYKGVHEDIIKGYDELPLQQKKYINTLMYRGLFGLAQYALVGYLLANGNMKYGGAYNPNDRKKVIGPDGKPLNYGEWELNGKKMPEVFNVIMNHSPYSLPASMAAIFYQNFKKGDVFKAITGLINEVYQRLPFQGTADIMRGILGDKFSAEKSVASAVPNMNKTAEFFDRDENGKVRPVKINTGEFLSTTKNMIQKGVPGARNIMETTKEGKFLPLSSAGLNIPSLGDRKSIRVNVTESHPEGQMTQEEYDKFAPLVEIKSKEKYDAIMQDKKESIDRLQELENKEKLSIDEKMEKTKLKKEIDNLISTEHRNAIKDAKEELNLNQ